jgi:chemotaxis signal transduction protein
LLKLEQRPLGPRARVLLLEADSGELLGLLVDEVSNVLRLSPAQLELSSGVFGGDLSEQIAGIGRPDGHTVMILLELGPLLSR